VRKSAPFGDDRVNCMMREPACFDRLSDQRKMVAHFLSLIPANDDKVSNTDLSVVEVVLNKKFELFFISVKNQNINLESPLLA
jgi:hypothetical protein